MSLKKQTTRRALKPPTNKATIISPSSNSILSSATAPSSLIVNLLFGLFVLTLFTPLIYSTTSFFGFVSERSIFFRFIVELMAFCILFQPVVYRNSFSLLQKSLLILLVVSGIAVWTGVDPLFSLYSGFLRMEGYIGYLHLGIYFLILSRIRFSRIYWHYALLISLGVSLLVVAIGYTRDSGWQTNHYRLIATIGNPSFLAVYLLLHVFVSGYISLQFNHINRWLRIVFFIVVSTLLILGIVLTGTRSAIIGLIAGFFVIVVLLIWQRVHSISRIMISLFGILFLLLCIYYFSSSVAIDQAFPSIQRLGNFSEGNNTFSPRVISWKIALNSIAARPVLGWGSENYTYAFARYYDPALLISGNTEWYDRVHSVFLEWACTTGILGLLSYCFLWFCLIRKLIKYNSFSFTSIALLSGVFVSYFFFNLLNPESLLANQVFFLLLAFIDSNNVSKEQAVISPKYVLVIRLSWILLTGWLLYTTVNTYQTLRQLDKQVQISNGFERMTFLKTIYDKAIIGQYEIADAIETLALSVFQTNVPADVRQFCYDQTMTVMTDQLTKHPKYSRLLLRIATFQTAAGKHNEAINLIKQAVDLDGNQRPVTLLQLGEAYLMAKDYPNALTCYQQAYQLQPTWEVPLIQQAFVYAIQQDTARSQALLRKINTRSLVENLALVKQVYQAAQNPYGIVRRISAVPIGDRYLFNRPVYKEWIFTAYDNGDLPEVEAALHDFDLHYYHYGIFINSDIKQLIKEAHKGIRPIKINEWLEKMPVSDEVPTI